VETLAIKEARFAFNLPQHLKKKIDLWNECSDNPNCQIDAPNDVAAVKLWLNRYSKKTTYNTYKKEANRFLLWCVYERGLSLKALKVQDFESYFNFLKNPPLSWIAQKRPGKKGRDESDWKPFLGPLSKTSLIAAIRIINSLMNYLVAADYLNRNPIRLIKQANHFQAENLERRFKARERMLEKEEWEALQATLNELPEATDAEIDKKIRAQFLFSILYLLGLRIQEVANHTWSSFRNYQGRWSFIVLGKGDKLKNLPVNDQLLSMIKIYRLYLQKTPLPEKHETEHLMVRKNSKKPLSTRLLFDIVKSIGQKAALKFTHEPAKAEKLKHLSPHWLRHMLASHQEQAGFSGTMIQELMRHGSFATTQIYLHSEEKLNHEAMQKIKMDIKPKIFTKREARLKTELHIILSRGHINLAHAEIGLKAFIAMVEDEVLKDLHFQACDSIAKVMERYKKTKALCHKIELTYVLEGSLHQDVEAYIKKAILRESEIRLFESEINLVTKIL